MKLFIILFLLISVTKATDDSLPVYMRGLKWNEVEKYLEYVPIAIELIDLQKLKFKLYITRQDPRLHDKFVPINYLIDLSVNVRGHAGAKKSDFNGD